MQTLVILMISRTTSVTAVQYNCVEDALSAYEELVSEYGKDILEVRIARADKGTVLTLMPGMSKEFVAEDLSTPFLWKDEDTLKIRPILKPQYWKDRAPENSDSDQQRVTKTLLGTVKQWVSDVCG